MSTNIKTNIKTNIVKNKKALLAYRRWLAERVWRKAFVEDTTAAPHLYKFIGKNNLINRR